MLAFLDYWLGLQMTPAENGFLWLIFIPFFIGILTGSVMRTAVKLPQSSSSDSISEIFTINWRSYLVDNPKRLALICFIATLAHFAPAFLVMSLINEFSFSEHLYLRMFLIAYIWTSMGVWTAYKAIGYLRFVGVRGYLFALGASLLGTSLSIILVEGPFSRFLEGKPIEIETQLTNYAFILCLGVALLWIGNWQFTSPGMNNVLTQIFSIFTVFGIINAILEFFWQNYIADLLWLTPQIPSPDLYGIFYPLAIACIGVFPSSMMKPGYADEKAVKSITTEGLESLPDSFLASLSLVQFSYKLPYEWIVVEQQHKESKLGDISIPQFVLKSRPPTRRILDSARLTSLDLIVSPYIKATIIDEGKFKKNTYENLSHVIFTEDKIGVKYGVMSHECLYQQENGYGYLVRFIVHGNEFVIRWYAPNRETLFRYLPDVKTFIDSFDFRSS